MFQRGKTAHTRISSAVADEKLTRGAFENLSRPNTTHTFRVGLNEIGLSESYRFFPIDESMVQRYRKIQAICCRTGLKSGRFHITQIVDTITAAIVDEHLRRQGLGHCAPPLWFAKTVHCVYFTLLQLLWGEDLFVFHRKCIKRCLNPGCSNGNFPYFCGEYLFFGLHINFGRKAPHKTPAYATVDEYLSAAFKTLWAGGTRFRKIVFTSFFFLNAT